MEDLTPELFFCIVKMWLTYTAMLRILSALSHATTLETI